MTDSRIRVLIAEDHLIARVGLTTIVNAQPDMAVVGEAADGREAIDAHARLAPDVTLMDLRLPLMGGVEAIAAIRRHTPEARVIVISTYTGDEDVHRAIEACARAYLTKDVLDAELVQTIRRVHQGEQYLSAFPAAALADRRTRPDLTARELEVLTRIVGGQGNKHIAYDLGIAEHTVKNHVKSILTKLDVDDRTQAATAALRRGLVRDE